MGIGDMNPAASHRQTSPPLAPPSAACLIMRAFVSWCIALERTPRSSPPVDKMRPEADIDYWRLPPFLFKGGHISLPNGEVAHVHRDFPKE
mmetsp:Transcript_15095/g.20229  ORF Transcript_15095/g.20229 Transcript_15095/m.20229 type:complete len:91 (-) Transcript_15095:100-372(-)